MKHGTGWAYHEGCRCAACYSAAVTARHRLRGTRPMVDAGQVRRHIDFLRARGISRYSIAEMAGVGYRTVYDTASGKTKRVTARVADAMLGLTADLIPQVGRTQTWRVQRLTSEMARRGIGRDELSAMLRHESPRSIEYIIGPQTVTKRTFDRVTTIYRYLAGQGIVPASVLDEVGV